MLRNRFYRTLRRFDSRGIGAVSILLFIVITLAIYISNRYMNTCLAREAVAQQNRIELHNLGEQLADASDYLTDEARKYAVSGEIEHLYNYWHEVYAAKTRDTVISTLSSYQPPENERTLLQEAKAFSDALIGTETVSMKLILLSKGETPETYAGDKVLYGYVQMVYDTPLPEAYADLAPEQMQNMAVSILYDSYYYASKEQIMSPIQEFQTAMDARLNSAVAASIQGQHSASTVQVICSVGVLTLVALLILGLHALYVRPLKRYGATLSAQHVQSQLEQQDLSRVLVTPQGARELYRFGESFNHLSLLLHRELKQRAEAEAAMRLARDEADRANQAKSDFFAQMSHELRTPLNAMIGYLYLLEQTDLQDSQREYCHAIDDAAENLLGLIKNILDFSKMESGKLELEQTDFDLPKLLGDVYHMMQSEAMQKKLNLELLASEQLPRFVKGDPLRLRQVLVNLLGNALKFTPKGTISLSAAVASVQEQEYVIAFGVRDTGIGIAPEHLAQIFQPFVQRDAGVTRTYGGTGLGLPISQRIVQSASDRVYSIQVESVPDKGSYFHFQMIFRPGTSPRPETAHRGTETAPQIDATILLVDDNEINLEVERLILAQYGLTVTTAQSGMEALGLAGQQPYDLIFLDLHMPQMDGYETARRLRMLQHCRHTPLIALTADVVSGTADRVMEAGMNTYLSKPFVPAQLGQLIAKYLHIAQESPEAIAAAGSPIFDYAACLEVLGGKEETLNRLVQQFLAEHQADGDYLQSHIAQGYWGNAEHILHDLVGVSGNLCCR